MYDLVLYRSLKFEPDDISTFVPPPIVFWLFFYNPFLWGSRTQSLYYNLELSMILVRKEGGTVKRTSPAETPMANPAPRKLCACSARCMDICLNVLDKHTQEDRENLLNSHISCSQNNCYTGFILSKECDRSAAGGGRDTQATHTSGLIQEGLTEGTRGTSLRPQPHEHHPFVSS